ncbi:MAG: hypothetical protein U9Q98_10695 [Bacteroidota bacterium]|nr:hypothetical protein [Bacteroidota bacterium]
MQRLRRKLFLPVSVSVIALVVVSCIGPKGTGRPAKYVQTFYSEGGATQYFVKPLEYESGKDYTLYADFTLRDTVKQPPVRMLYTLHSEEPLSGHSSCKAGVREKDVMKADKIYAEPVNKGYDYRYELIIPFNDFVLLIREKSDLHVSLGENTFRFTPIRKTEKALDKVDNIVLMMMETR